MCVVGWKHPAQIIFILLCMARAVLNTNSSVDRLRSEGRGSLVHFHHQKSRCTCAVPSLPDQKASRTALQFPRRFSNRFSLLCSCLAVLNVCAFVCVCVCTCVCLLHVPCPLPRRRMSNATVCRLLLHLGLARFPSRWAAPAGGQGATGGSGRSFVGSSWFAPSPASATCSRRTPSPSP